MAMVIGPTPPGTGVIAPATARASAKATSPDQPRLAVAAFRRRDSRLIPTSMTMAPGLIQSPRTISALADGGDHDLAATRDRRQIAGPGMGDRHRAIGIEKQLRHWPADDASSGR